MRKPASACLVSDKFQGEGIGMELVKRLINVAKQEKIKTIIAVMSPENETMKVICQKTGFSGFTTNTKTEMIEASITL